MKLSVIIPVYNEEETIYELIHQVNNQKKNQFYYLNLTFI